MHVTILLVAAAAAAVLAWVWARLRQAPASDTYYTFHCPECGQKIRYLAARAGRPALCPRCKRPATLPLAPPVIHRYPGPVPHGAARVGQRRAS